MYNKPPKSKNAHVTELLGRFHRHKEMDSAVLDRGEIALIGAVFMDTVEDPEWVPSPHIENLLREINGKLEHAEQHR